jgi:hypothetical protein
MHRHSIRRASVWALMVASCLAVVLAAVAVRVALADQERAVTTVGQNDTAGIRAAQRVKSDLAEMDLIVTQELLRPTAEKGTLPDAYNAKHRELVANLDVAGRGITLGTAETVPLANLQYERSQYQSLVRDAVLADQAGDRARALGLQKQAHQVMVGVLGLQEQADAFDKANTYALNQSYESHKAGSGSSRSLLLVSGAVLVLMLAAAQFFHALSFHRVINIALVTAVLTACGVLGFAISHINSSSQHLTDARERAFDPVHELWQARATVYAVRQAEAQALLDPAAAADWEKQFQTSAGRLYRLPTGGSSAVVAASARSASAPPGSGGYLARALTGRAVSPEGQDANRTALVQFGEFLDAHDRILAAGSVTTSPAAVSGFFGDGNGDNGRAFSRLLGAVDVTLDLNEHAFDTNAQAAADALDGVGLIAVAGAGAIAALALWGLGLRLREYAPS